MAHVEITEIGRGAPEPFTYPVLEGRDPLVILAMEIEGYLEQRAIISPIHGEVNSFVVWRRNRPFVRPVIRVRIVDVGIAADQEATQRMEAVAS